MTERRRTEFAAGGSATALRGLAQASGHDVAYLVRLAQQGQLQRIFTRGKTFRISTPPMEEVPITVTARRGAALSPRQAQLRLRAKRFGRA
jgi:hypothetical protein